ncbi:nitric oxide associated protein 1 [Dionaea muscipula]
MAPSVAIVAEENQQIHPSPPLRPAFQICFSIADLPRSIRAVEKKVDIVDFSGSFLSHVRDLVGANLIILVITKVDLLPKGTDLNCIGDWVVEATAKKRLNVLSVHLTSSKSKIGITGVVSEIRKEKNRFVGVEENKISEVK